jgi:hypothetical protein
VDQRAKQESLESIFGQLRSGEMPENEILALAQEIGISDVKWMMERIERLNGPEDFMDDINEFDDADNARSVFIAEGFYLFVDLVSAMILMLGDIAIAEARKIEGSSAHYVSWVIKFCTDKRFTNGLRENFPFLDI